MIKYIPAPDIKFDLERIANKLRPGVKLDQIVCIRSTGSKAVGTLARCWGMPIIWQVALGIKPHYVIEVISEQFDRLDKGEQERVLIHELMHVPAKFGGGLRNHDREFGKTINNRFMDKLHRIVNGLFYLRHRDYDYLERNLSEKCQWGLNIQNGCQSFSVRINIMAGEFFAQATFKYYWFTNLDCNR